MSYITVQCFCCIYFRKDVYNKWNKMLTNDKIPQKQMSSLLTKPRWTLYALKNIVCIATDDLRLTLSPSVERLSKN